MVYEKAVLKADHPHALYQRALSKFFRGVSPVLQQELKVRASSNSASLR